MDLSTRQPFSPGRRYRADFQNMEFNYTDETRAYPLDLRCPHCGSWAELVQQQLTSGQYRKRNIYFIRCAMRCCGFQGPTLDDSQKAVTHWRTYYALAKS